MNVSIVVNLIEKTSGSQHLAFANPSQSSFHPIVANWVRVSI
jgi:hypothetical protein